MVWYYGFVFMNSTLIMFDDVIVCDVSTAISSSGMDTCEKCNMCEYV